MLHVLDIASLLAGCHPQLLRVPPLPLACGLTAQPLPSRPLIRRKKTLWDKIDTDSLLVACKNLQREIESMPAVSRRFVCYHPP
jgi:hypothetical protein